MNTLIPRDGTLRGQKNRIPARKADNYSIPNAIRPGGVV